MKTNQKEIREKRLRASAQELKELRRVLNRPPVRHFKKPVQRGFMRYHALTASAELRADAQMLREILGVIGTKFYFWRDSFLPGQRPGRSVTELEQPLVPIPEDVWWSVYQYRWDDYFVRRELTENPDRLYDFERPELFELRIEPHWVSHQKEVDAELLKRKKELEAVFYPPKRREPYRRPKMKREAE